MIPPLVFIQPYERGLGPGRDQARPRLARILNMPECALVFGEAETGKPFIANPPGVHVSISHSGGYLAVYVGPEEGGIDIELLKSRRNIDDIVAFWFTEAEKRAIREWKGDPLLGFYRVWTEKEARLKLLGSETIPPGASVTDRIARHWLSDDGFMLCVYAGRGIIDNLEFDYADGVDFRAKMLE